jgi:hypothetical protein
VDLAIKGRIPLTAAAARIFHAREAILARSSTAEELMKKAKTSLQQVKIPGMTFYLAKLEILQRHPEKAAEIFNPISSSLSASLGHTTDVKAGPNPF